jgi:hypothetical protein
MESSAAVAAAAEFLWNLQQLLPHKAKTDQRATFAAPSGEFEEAPVRYIGEFEAELPESIAGV